MKLDQLFFAFNDGSNAPELDALAPDYEVEFWTPRRFVMRPKGLPAMPFAVWGLFHHAHIFSNRDYGIILIRRAGMLVHRSCVFPRYFRFPFMARADLQVGDTWTAPEERGKGLGKWALASAVCRCRARGTTLWYVCDEWNDASAAVASRVGFQCVGRGARNKWHGIDLFGHFEILQR